MTSLQIDPSLLDDGLLVCLLKSFIDDGLLVCLLKAYIDDGMCACDVAGSS